MIIIIIVINTGCYTSECQSQLTALMKPHQALKA